MGDSCSTVQMYTFLYQGCTLTWHHLNLHQSPDQSQIVCVMMAIQNTRAGCQDLVKNIQAGWKTLTVLQDTKTDHQGNMDVSVLI